MKKMKKLFAILMTMAMVMGLGITGFAAANDTGDITVTGLVKENTTIEVYQILKADTNVNNWEIVDWAKEVSGAVTLDSVNNEYDIDWNALYQNLPSADAVTENENYWKATTENGSYTFEELPLGAYLVKATSDVTGSGTVYNVMGTYNTDYNGSTHLMVGKDATVYAKASKIPVTKEADDNFVAKGETVTFTVTTTFPSFTDEELGYTPAPVFKIKDTPTGLNITGVTAVYIGEANNPANKLEENKDYTAGYGSGADAGNYYIDLSSQIGTENANAGKTVTITYTATVTADDGYSNTANIVKNDTTIGTGGDEEGYTADLTVVKKNESNEVLSGAVFKVYMSTISEDDAANKTSQTRKLLYFIGQDGEYSLAEQDETMEVGGDTITATTDIVTNSGGNVQIKGLGEGYYFFDEVEAPEGYTINTNGVKFTVSDKKLDSTGNPTEEFIGADVSLTKDLVDTKMAALPSTGGMGTTLFTIAGCVIMISAAGLFFATRKKAN